MDRGFSDPFVEGDGSLIRSKKKGTENEVISE